MRISKWMLIGIVFLSPLFLQAQDAEGTNAGLYRYIEIGTELNTGTLVNNTWKTLNGNYLEVFGVYKQNFAAVPWFSWEMRLSTIASASFNHLQNNKTDTGKTDPKYALNGLESVSYGFNYFETGFTFSDYAYLGLRHDLLMLIDLYYPIVISTGHSITIGTSFEINPYFRGTIIDSADPNGEDPGVQKAATLQLFKVNMAYQFKHNSGWSVVSDLAFRSHGAGGNVPGSTLPAPWEWDSLDAFRYNLSFRWENTVRYESSRGFYAFLSLRYDIGNLIVNDYMKSQGELIGQALHDVYILTGMGYKFNFQG